LFTRTATTRLSPLSLHDALPIMFARVTGSFHGRSVVQSTISAPSAPPRCTNIRSPIEPSTPNAPERTLGRDQPPSVSAVAKRTSHGTCRGSVQRRKRSAGSGGLDCVLERLARAERSRNGRSDPDLRSRPGITTRARLALTRLKRAEARDLDSVPALQRLRDETGLRVKERIDGACCIRLAHPGPVRELLHQIRLVHWIAPG